MSKIIRREVVFVAFDLIVLELTLRLFAVLEVVPPEVFAS